MLKDWERIHAFVWGAGHKTPDDISPTLQSLPCLLCSLMLCKTTLYAHTERIWKGKKTLPQTTPHVSPLIHTLPPALENEPKSSTVLVQSR